MRKTQTRFSAPTFLGALLALPLALGCAQRGAAPTSEAPTETAATGGESAVETLPSGSWVQLSGTVSSTAPGRFQLDHGEGHIVVEMDDWDGWDEARHLVVDDRVVVYGFIDDDFLDRRTIEASSVYVRGLGTQFYASGVDEEDFPVVSVALVPEARLELTGTVTEVEVDEFVLDTEAGLIDVNVEELGYDPLDELGYQQLDVGDRVRVTGRVGTELFADRDLMADRVVTLESAI